MTVSVDVSEFFVAGGTLRPDTPSYVARTADDELFQKALAGEFCYVLTPRQMGKSSLMVRTARRLTAVGVHTAIIDLTAIGTEVTPEEWYFGLISRLNAQLRVSDDVQQWWTARANLGVVQRFTDFLRDVLLGTLQGKVVVFVDEIDTTLKIPFSDDFFAAIRSVYNERASDPVYQNLTFILLGVATPADLIKDRARTPFNIGQRIDLGDFQRSDAEILQQGLEVVYPGQSDLIFARIFDWTGGHPYLTQKLCLAAIEDGNAAWTPTAVDDLVQSLFLSEAAQKETNLQFIRDQLRSLSIVEQRQVLDVYNQVYQGRAVPEDERSFAQNQLKLVGLVQANDGQLKVRNEIYRRVFDKAWINETFPVDWMRRLTIVGAAVVLLLLVVAALLLLREPEPTWEEQIEEQRQLFLQTSNPTVRLTSLGMLYSQYEVTATIIARQSFHELSLPEQITIFRNSDVTDLHDKLWWAAVGTYSDFQYAVTQPDDFTRLLGTIEEALLRSDGAENAMLLVTQINFWLECRIAATEKNYEQALTSCTNALERVRTGELGPNPVLIYDLSQAYAGIGDSDAVLESFNSLLDTSVYEGTKVSFLITLDDLTFMRQHIFDLLMEDTELQNHLQHQPGQYPVLEALIGQGP